MTKPSCASCRIVRSSGALAVIAGSFGFLAVAAEPGDRHGQLDESSRRSEAARSIQQTYVQGLELRGKAASQAIDTLLINGFRCGLRAPDDVPIFKEDAMRVSCSQDGTKINVECPTLTLQLNAQWSRAVSTRPEMLDQLDSSKITSASARCPGPIVGSAEFVAQQKPAQRSLAQQAAQYAVVGKTAKQAFDRLIANGFDCGIGPVEDSASGLDATLDCRRLPGLIDWCFDAELLLRVRWKQPHRTPTDRVRDLQGATVQSIKSQCRLPPMSGDLSA